MVKQFQEGQIVYIYFGGPVAAKVVHETNFYVFLDFQYFERHKVNKKEVYTDFESLRNSYVTKWNQRAAHAEDEARKWSNYAKEMESKSAPEFQPVDREKKRASIETLKRSISAE